MTDEFFVQAPKIIALNACIAEGDGCLDDVLELAGIGEASVLTDNLKEQPRITTGYFELGQEIIQDRFCDFLQVVLGVSVEINNGVKTARKSLVKVLEKVRRGDDGNLFVQVVEALENGRRGAAHFAKVARVGSVEGDGVYLIEQDENFFRVRKMVQLIEQCGDVLLRLAELAVDDGVEIDAEQVALQNAGDLPYGFGLARSGCALEQELVDSHVPLDGVDDSDNVLLNGRRERQRIVRRGDFAEKGHLVFVHLRHKGVRAGHKGHDVFRKLKIAASVKIPGNFVCLLAESGVVFLGVIANQIDNILLFHGLDLPSFLI